MSINPDHIDNLAWIIREVDEEKRLTATELAEAILNHPGNMWHPPDNLVQPEVSNCARIELVGALHSLASQFENETAAFTGDDLTAVKGHIAHARNIATRHNQNGPGCAPLALEPAPGGFFNATHKCSNCQSENLEWGFSLQYVSADLGGDKTKSVFVLGCLDCSETVQIVDAEDVAIWINGQGVTPAAPPAPEAMEAAGYCARIELVVALQSLASQFENETAAFTGDDLTAVKGHIEHARKIAARHNQNGPGCAPAVVLCERPPTVEAGDLDREGRCWWGNAGGGEFVPSWRLCEDPHDSRFTEWRPHHSIPLPQSGEDEA